MNPIDLSARILGCLWGSLVGDALGVPVEFLSREHVQANPVTDMRGFGTHRQPAGTWSDDSSLLICTVDSLLTRERYHAEDLGERFVRWERDSFWTPHGVVFDIGGATSHALSRIAQGIPVELAGGVEERSNGNGSLMRIAPLALWHLTQSPTELAELSQRASAITHRHLRSQMACAFYCLVLRELLHEKSAEEASRSAFAIFFELYRQPAYSQELPHFRPLEVGALCERSEPQIGSGGYVMETLTASLWCLLTTDTFEAAVLKAVNLGSDTDTTGTVTGGLAGALYGASAIPPIWKNALARHDELETLFARFAAQIARPIPLSA